MKVRVGFCPELPELPEFYLEDYITDVILGQVLAYAIGMSFATVNRWENGKTVPSELAQRQFEQFCANKKE